MSPRGVYDRKGSGRKSASKTVGKTAGGTVTTGAKVVALPTLNNVEERFAILRNNITTLVHVRSTLSGTDDVANKTEAEIIQHIVALTDLRKQIFGQTSEEQETERVKTLSTVGNGHMNVVAPSISGPTPTA